MNFDQAQSDIQARKLREQQVEAERLLEALSAALKEDGHKLLSIAEYRDLDKALEELKIVHNSGDADAIQREIERLSQLSEDFVANVWTTILNKR